MVARGLSLLRVAAVGLWTLLWTSFALLVFLVSRDHRVPLALARRVWAPGVLRIVGVRLEVIGLERVDFGKSHLFVANHSSQLDIPVAFATLPVPLRFLAKKELARVPLVGLYIAAMGMVFIDRDDSNAARASIDRLAESLTEGLSLMVFPEGTRSSGGEIRPFKTGAFVAAINSGVSVVPVRIVGAARVLPANSLQIRPGRVRVVVGEPVPTGALTLDDRRGLADHLRQCLIDLSESPDR